MTCRGEPSQAGPGGQIDTNTLRENLFRPNAIRAYLAHNNNIPAPLSLQSASVDWGFRVLVLGMIVFILASVVVRARHEVTGEAYIVKTSDVSVSLQEFLFRQPITRSEMETEQKPDKVPSEFLIIATFPGDSVPFLQQGKKLEFFIDCVDPLKLEGVVLPTRFSSHWPRPGVGLETAMRKEESGIAAIVGASYQGPIQGVDTTEDRTNTCGARVVLPGDRLISLAIGIFSGKTHGQRTN